MKCLRSLVLLTVYLSFLAAAGSLNVAHLHRQGVDMIIVPVSDKIGYASQRDRSDFLYALQLCASSAGLAGEVVPV